MLFDNFFPTEKKALRGIADTINSKLSRQADGVVVNLDRSSFSLEDLAGYLSQYPPGVPGNYIQKPVIAIKNGVIENVF